MRRAFYLALLSSSNLILSFLLHLYVLDTIGIGMETDAFIAAMVVPQLVLSVVSGSIMHVLVPLLVGVEPERFSQEAWGFFIIIGAFFGSLAVLLYLFVPLWVPLLVPGFSDTGKSLTVALTRIQLVGMIFFALSGVLLAVNHARQRFIWPEITPLLSTLVGFIILVPALARYGIVAAAWVSVLRVFLQTLFMLVGLGGYRRPDLMGPMIRQAWQRIKPLLLGATYFKTGPVIDRFLSSMTPAGGVSLLFLGQQVYEMAAQIIHKAMVAPIVPLLAGLSKAERWAMFRHCYRKRLFFIIGLTGFCYLGVILVGQTLLMLLTGYGGITKENVRLLWQVMLALVGVFMGGAMGQIISCAFYAKGNTATPTKLGLMSYTAVGLPLKAIGFIQFGLLGIAFGSTVYYFFNVLALFILLEKELHRGCSVNHVLST